MDPAECTSRGYNSVAVQEQTQFHEAPGQANEHLHIQLRRGTYDNVAWR